MNKTICYFGNFYPDYPRNKLLIRSLQKNGFKVLKCKCRTSEGRVKRHIELLRKHWKIKNKYDLLWVGYADYSRFYVLLAKIISNKPIIWDAFYSLYDAKVIDRKEVSSKHLKAKYYWILDWLACKLADKILLDTEEHIRYFVKTFKIKKDKFIKVLVGTDNKFFYPRKERIKKKRQFIIHFHGSYIPLQGVEYILRAANLLERKNIKFNIIGSKIKKQYQNKEFSNAVFVDDVPYKELPNYMARADICLGIFGNTPKTQRVIPNKVYEAIAMKKPVITADTPAARELFTDRKNILFCKTANPDDLAKKILELKNNEKLRNLIAQGGYKIFKKYATSELIGNNLLKKLSKILGRDLTQEWLK